MADRPSDPLVNLATLFAFVFLMYFLHLTVGVRFPVVEVGWATLLGWLLITGKAKVILPVLAIHFALATLYLSGSTEGAPYLRVILSSFVFCSLSLSILSGSARGIRQIRVSDAGQIRFQRLLLVGLVIWTILSLRYIRMAHVADVRDITGSNYLTTSDLLALVGLAMLSRHRIRSLEYLAITLACAFCLMFLGSRASMALFAAVAVGGFFLRFRTGKSLIAGLAIGPAVAYFSISNLEVMTSKAFARFVSIFSLGNDQSLDRRGQFLQERLEVWSDNPLCLIVPCPGSPGHYIHNALSLVEHFGIVGVAILLMALLVILMNVGRLSSQPAVLVLGYLFVSFAVARAWVSPVFPVFLAFILLFAMKPLYAMKSPLLHRR